MGDLLVGLADAVTGDSPEDVAMDGGNTPPAPKNMQGKKAVIEPSARTTRSKSTRQPLDSTTRVTKSKGKEVMDLYYTACLYVHVMFDTRDISSDCVSIADGASSFMMRATFQAD